MHIALIDDDEAVLDLLRLFLTRNGIETSCFTSADLFVSTDGDKDFDYIVADVRMPGMSGLELVDFLSARSVHPEIILITGHGDVEMAVTALKKGAFDFIEKPFDERRLLDSIGGGKGDGLNQTPGSPEPLRSDLELRFASLSERQRQVMLLATQGLSNKEIATHLGISPRTVEIYRAWVMERMGARNLAHLVRMEMTLTPKNLNQRR